MDKTIKELVIKLGEQLKKRKYSIVTAESCTGGGLSYHISCIPECSPLLERGFVTYSDQAKEELLGVNLHTIQTHGAVSKETALEMAEGARRNSKAHISVAITGIAGDDNKEDKTGVVWIACTGVDLKPFLVKKIIKGNRNEFINMCIIESLNALIDFVK